MSEQKEREMSASEDRPAAPRRRSAAALMLVLALLLGACATAEGSDTGGGASGGLTIVATTTILADVAREVAGDGAEVTALMEPGADPHNVEASARQLAELQQADLVVSNGGNLEEHLLDPLAEAERAGVPVFHALDHIAPLRIGAAGDDAAGETEDHATEVGTEDHAADGEADHAHEEGAVDPHFWMDPTRTAQVARALGDRIDELRGDGGAAARAATYAERLEEADAQVADALAAIPAARRTLVTNHEAFGYFAERYGFTIVGTVIPSLSTGAEPSARDLEELARTIERQRTPAVFVENTAPAQLAETLAQEVGSAVQVVELYSDSLGPEGSDAETYVGMLEANAERIVQALAG